MQTMQQYCLVTQTMAATWDTSASFSLPHWPMKRDDMNDMNAVILN